MEDFRKKVSAEIVTVGTELLLGHIIDTNSAFISNKLAELGINVYFKTAVGDNDERLMEALKLAAKRADIIIVTGGLGPTVDDITKNSVVKLLNRNLILNERVLEKIKSFFEKRKIRMPQNNVSQALVPSGATIIENNNGTAPGLILKSEDEKIFILMPGVPREMVAMVDETVIPYLKDTFSLEGIIKSRTIKTFGLGESTIDEKIEDLFRYSTNPTIALLASHTEVKVRLTSSAKDLATAEESISKVENEIKKRLGDNVFGVDNETMEGNVAVLMTMKRLTLSVAESCTGGLIASKITNIPGSSVFFKLGAVTYSNEAKTDILRVPEQAINMFGSVSKQVAEEMALGVKKAGKSELGLALTGVAGPGGGTDEKPIGLVYIALSTETEVTVKEHRFTGDRIKIQEQAAQTALDMLRRHLLKR